MSLQDGPPHDGRILLVEDDPAVMRVTISMLESSGYLVIAAPNAKEAKEAFAANQGKIDMLLTDVVMPGMSGKDLALALAGTSPGLRVLFMSGYTDNAIHHHGVLEPGTAFIEKPFSQAALTAKIRGVLGGI